MNLNNCELIKHPENLLEGRKYSVLILSGGKARRVTGRFQAIDVAYTQVANKPRKSFLAIILERASDVLVLPWLQSKDWRDVT